LLTIVFSDTDMVATQQQPSPNSVDTPLDMEASSAQASHRPPMPETQLWLWMPLMAALTDDFSGDRLSEVVPQ